MSEIKIRQATIEDMPEIQRLSKIHFELSEKQFDNLWNTNWPFEKEGIEWLEKQISEKNSITFVTINHNEIVGFLTASSAIDTRFKDNLKKAELTSMFVLQTYRSQGVGSKLVKEFQDWAKKNQAKRLIVNTDFCSDAVRFYKKNGFTEYGIELKTDL